MTLVSVDVTHMPSSEGSSSIYCTGNAHPKAVEWEVKGSTLDIGWQRRQPKFWAKDTNNWNIDEHCLECWIGICLQPVTLWFPTPRVCNWLGTCFHLQMEIPALPKLRYVLPIGSLGDQASWSGSVDQCRSYFGVGLAIFKQYTTTTICSIFCWASATFPSLHIKSSLGMCSWVSAIFKSNEDCYHKWITNDGDSAQSSIMYGNGLD